MNWHGLGIEYGWAWFLGLIFLITAILVWGLRREKKLMSKDPHDIYDKFRAVIRGEHVWLWIEEYHPLEPSAYVWDPGWTCYTEDGSQEYFVNDAGWVFAVERDEAEGITRNDLVGEVPTIAANSAIFEINMLPEEELDREIKEAFAN